MDGQDDAEIAAALPNEPLHAVVFVGGPWDGVQGQRQALPAEIGRPVEIPGPAAARYLRSARCADDGAVRYVWREAPDN